MNRKHRLSCFPLYGRHLRPAFLGLCLILLLGRIAQARPLELPSANGRVPLACSPTLDWSEIRQGSSLSATAGEWKSGTLPDRAAAWHPSSRQAHRGRSWRIGRDEGGYAPLALDWLESPPVQIRRSSRLSFRLRYQTETPEDLPGGYDGWDGGNVWISVDGAAWQVLDGFSHAYNCRSLFSFGREFGLGDEVPGWSGRSDWRKVQRELGSFAGHKVAFRFAFCSDQAGGESERFCGLQVDDIQIQAGSTIQLRNDAEASAQPGSWKILSGRQTEAWRPGPLAASSSPTFQLTLKPGPDVTLDSPSWSLPVDAETWLSFQTGLADSSEGELGGELALDLSSDDGHSWQRIWRSSFSEPTGQVLLPLGAWAGSSVRLRWTSQVAEPRTTEDSTLGRLWLEEPQLIALPRPPRDAELAELVAAYPRSVGLPADLLLLVRNGGREALPPLSLQLSLDGREPLPVPSARPLPAGEVQEIASCWVPEQAGPHDLVAWLDGARDERCGNDSLWVGPVEVQPEGELEFGYSFRQADSYFTGGDPLLFVDELDRLELGDFAPRRVTIGFCDPESRAEGKSIRLHILADEEGQPGQDLWQADYRLESLGERFLWEFEVEEELRLTGNFWVWAERRDAYPHVLGAPLLWKPGHYALGNADQAELDFSRGAKAQELLFWVSGVQLPPEPEPLLPSGDFALGGAHPNPFNPATTLDFQAPVGEFVSVRVYNLAGQEVALLFEGAATGGPQQAHFDAGRLASGVYFACLESESRVSTLKLVLSK